MRAFLQTLAASGREHVDALAALGRRLIRDRRGNILIITGFALIPITFSTGMVVDYSRAARLQTKLNAVADASVLAATTTPMLKKSSTYACNAALNAFINGSTGLPGLTFSVVHAGDLTITLDEAYASGDPQHIACQNTQQAAGGGEVVPISRTANLTYSGKSANAFGGVLGSSTIDIGGRSSSKVSVAPFIDIHMALDTSQSMGLAASSADAIKLFALTGTQNGSKNSCTFGCHAYTAGKNDNYPLGSTNSKNTAHISNDAIAANNSVKLRIDVLKTATQDMIGTALANPLTSQNYQFALYRIGRISNANASDTFSTISTLSTDLAGTRQTVGNLTLGWNNSSGVGDTDLATMATSVLPKITAHGDGTTRAKARAFLFIVTDGVSDLPPVSGTCTSGHCTGPIAAAACDAYKSANVTVGVVYTTYLPIYLDPNNASNNPVNGPFEGNYNSLVKPFSDKIATNLRACASSGWYFEASDGDTIHAAMQKLFAQASQTPTIIR